MKSILASALVAGFALSAVAGTYNWTGGAGAQDGAYDWTAPANWGVESGYPGSAQGDEAVFQVSASDIAVAVDQAITVARLRAAPGTTKTVTLKGSGSLAITGGSADPSDALFGNATGTSTAEMIDVSGLTSVFNVQIPVTFANTTASTLYWHAGETVASNLTLQCQSGCTLQLLRYKLANQTFAGPSCAIDLAGADSLKVAYTTPIGPESHNYGNVSVYANDGARLSLPQTELYFNSIFQQEGETTRTTVRDELKIACKSSAFKMMGGVFEVTGASGRIYTDSTDGTPYFAISGGKVIAHAIVNNTPGGSSTITGGTLKVAEFNTAGTRAVALSGNVTFDLAEEDAQTAVGNVTFSSATVTLDVGARTFDDEKVLLAWSDVPTGVEFVLSGENIANTFLIPSQTGLVCRVQSADSVVDVAVWTGAGNDGDPTNLANWNCTNAQGSAIASNPMFVAGSQLRVFGEGVYVNFTPSALPTGVISVGDCTLSADCDWSGLTFTSIVAQNATIDLAGHSLLVAAPTGTTVGDARTFTDTVGHGLLRVTVPEGYFVNGGTVLEGGLCLVKEGPGALLAKKLGQEYTGGTIVSNGVLAVFNETENSTTYSLKKLPFGPSNACITVAKDAHFNIVGNYDGYIYRFVIDGGVIESNNSPERSGWFQQGNENWAGLGNITLTDDSTYNPRFNMIQSHGTVDLGGHVLTIGEYFDKKLVWKSAVTNGTIVCKLKANTNASSANKGFGLVIAAAVDARTVDFVMEGSFAMNADLSVRNYVARYEQNDNSGSSELKVYGTFKPGAHDYFYGCTLQDGAAIDFSARTTALPSTSAFTNGRKALGFATGAKIAVDVGERTIDRAGEKLLAWTAAPQASFKASDAMRARGFKTVAREDGLYAERAGGLVVLVR